MAKSPVALLGVPLDLGAQNLGVEQGPAAFRAQQIIDKLTSVGLEVVDGGDVEVKPRKDLKVGDPKAKYLAEIVRVSQEVCSRSAQALNSHQRVLALGGDHSAQLGAFAGAAQVFNQNIGLIYLDAHGDMNTPQTSQTGNIHGMHLAALMGFGPDELVHVGSAGPLLNTDHLLHVGGKDMDPGELELIERENIANFSMFDLMTRGLGPLLPMIDQLKSKVTNVWVSLDLDCIDMVYAPGAAMPNRGGLTYREISTICGYIGQHLNVVGLDVVELNPSQDEAGKTAELGIELAAKLLGSDYSWYTNYLADHAR